MSDPLCPAELRRLAQNQRLISEHQRGEVADALDWAADELDKATALHKLEEAFEWLSGERSMTNIIPREPFESWSIRIAEADAAMVQQAYWIVKAHREGLIR